MKILIKYFSFKNNLIKYAFNIRKKYSLMNKNVSEKEEFDGLDEESTHY